MSCSYCSVCPRHPCTSRGEAAHCANNDDPGSCMDFQARDVAAWIRSYAYKDAELLAAADLIEQRL